MNLKQARKLGRFKQFAKQHKIKDPHPRGGQRFHALLHAMEMGILETKKRRSNLRRSAKCSSSTSGAFCVRGPLVRALRRTVEGRWALSAG